MLSGVKTELKTKSAGFTLLEVMIAAGLTLLLLGIVIKIFVPAMSHSSQGTTRLELQQFAILAQQQIHRELSRTRFGGVSVADSNLLVHPQASLDSAGQPIWSDHVILFHLDSGSGKLGKYKLSSTPEKPNRYDPAGLLTLASSLPNPDKIIAGFVTEFHARMPVPATATVAGKPFQVKLVLEKKIARMDKPVQISLTQTFAFRTAE